MKKNIILSAICAGVISACLLIPTSAKAQSNLIYSSQRIPNANEYNPAFFPKNSKMYLSLPGANLKFQSPLSIDNIFQYAPGDTATFINFNAILDTLKDNSKIALDAKIPLVGLGVKFGKNFITLNSSINLGTRLGVPSGIATFLNEGNYGYRGVGNELYLLDGDLLNVNLYAEVGLAYGRQITDNLTIGARVKVMDGYFNLSTDKTLVKLFTDENLNEVSADVYYQLNEAGVIAFDSTGNASITSYIPKNFGVGFDLGARYETDRFDFSASLVDFASTISWSDNCKKIVPANGEGTLSFGGLDMSGLISGGSIDTTILSGLTDSIMSIVTPAFIEGESYTTSVPTKLNLSASYKIFDWLRVGALFHGEFGKTIKQVSTLNSEMRNSGFSSSTSIVGEVNLFDWFEVIANFSVVDDGHSINWFNPGIGVNLSIARTLQVYAMMDYISNLHLVEAKSFNVSVGLNLLFGRDKKK